MTLACGRPGGTRARPRETEAGLYALPPCPSCLAAPSCAPCAPGWRAPPPLRWRHQGVADGAVVEGMHEWRQWRRAGGSGAGTLHTLVQMSHCQYTALVDNHTPIPAAADLVGHHKYRGEPNAGRDSFGLQPLGCQWQRQREEKHAELLGDRRPLDALRPDEEELPAAAMTKTPRLSTAKGQLGGVTLTKVEAKWVTP